MKRRQTITPCEIDTKESNTKFAEFSLKDVPGMIFKGIDDLYSDRHVKDFPESLQNIKTIVEPAVLLPLKVTEANKSNHMQDRTTAISLSCIEPIQQQNDRIPSEVNQSEAGIHARTQHYHRHHTSSAEASEKLFSTTSSMRSSSLPALHRSSIASNLPLPIGAVICPNTLTSNTFCRSTLEDLQTDRQISTRRPSFPIKQLAMLSLIHI